MLYTLALGGDGRVRLGEPFRKSEYTNPAPHRYASDITRRHYVPTFVFDAFHNDWKMHYFRNAPAFKKGDQIDTIFLGQHSRVDDVVFVNKRPSFVLDAEGVATATPTKVKLEVMDGDKVRGSQEVSLGEAGLFSVDMSLWSGTATSSSTSNSTLNGDKVTTNTTTTSTVQGAVGKVYMANNGTVRITILEGDIMDACFELKAEVVDFAAVRGCECPTTTCETTYPEPMCM